jgi:hypothetical protein
MTEEEHLAQMAERLGKIEELMRGRPYREDRHVFKNTDKRSKFLTEIGFYDDSAASDEYALKTAADGRRIAGRKAVSNEGWIRWDLAR